MLAGPGDRQDRRGNIIQTWCVFLSAFPFAFLDVHNSRGTGVSFAGGFKVCDCFVPVAAGVLGVLLDVACTVRQSADKL